jgi:hypothetical protein
MSYSAAQLWCYLDVAGKNSLSILYPLFFCSLCFTNRSGGQHQLLLDKKRYGACLRVGKRYKLGSARAARWVCIPRLVKPKF